MDYSSFTRWKRARCTIWTKKWTITSQEICTSNSSRLKFFSWDPAAVDTRKLISVQQKWHEAWLLDHNTSLGTFLDAGPCWDWNNSKLELGDQASHTSDDDAGRPWIDSDSDLKAMVLKQQASREAIAAKQEKQLFHCPKLEKRENGQHKWSLVLA